MAMQYLLLNASRAETPDGNNCYFSIYDPITKVVENVEMPLKLGHAVVGNPMHRRYAVALEQYGKYMAEFDLLERGLTRLIQAGPGRAFYGHGVFSSDGRHFFSTEISDDARQEGFLVVRDGQSLEEIEVMPSHGKRPHDLALLQSGKMLVVANQGSRHVDANGELSSLTYIEVGTGKLIRRLEEPTEGYLLSHLALDADGKGAVACFNPTDRYDEDAKKIRQMISDPKTRVQGFRRQQESVEFRPVPIVFVNERIEHHAPSEVFSDMRTTLSICMHSETGVVAGIHVSGSLVTFSDCESNALKSYHRMDTAPVGVVLNEDRTEFVVSTGDNSLYYFQAESGAFLRKESPTGFRFAHHMTAWSM